jgi:hypothetical protein
MSSSQINIIQPVVTVTITLIFSIIMQLQDHGQVLSNSNVNLVTWDDFIAGTWLETTSVGHFHLSCSRVHLPI